MLVFNVCVWSLCLVVVCNVLPCLERVLLNKHAGAIPSSTYRERSHKVSQGSWIRSLAWAAALENGWQRTYICIFIYIHTYTHIYSKRATGPTDMYAYNYICCMQRAMHHAGCICSGIAPFFNSRFLDSRCVYIKYMHMQIQVWYMTRVKTYTCKQVSFIYLYIYIYLHLHAYTCTEHVLQKALRQFQIQFHSLQK